ncbi:MAG: hypothetical protein QHC40_14765 [Sphingobium sp.]|nr:hypothetical protein [Sphingobium sp.]
MTSLTSFFSSNEKGGRSTPERRADPLPRLLRQLLARANGPCEVVRTASRPWASALFQGRRHEMILRLSGADVPARLENMVEGLADAPFALDGHFVADIIADARHIAYAADGAPMATLELSALTIEEW